MKNELVLAVGSEVLYGGEPCVIKAHLSLSSVLLATKSRGTERVVRPQDLAPVDQAADDQPLRESGMTRLPEGVWQEAERRAAVLGPLADRAVVSRAQAQEAAGTLGLSERTVYTLLRRYRASGGLLTSLVAGRPSGGRGKGRLPVAIETIITTTIAEIYLSRPKRRMEDVVQEVRRRCVSAHLTPPGPRAVRARVQALPALATTRRRHGRSATRPLTPVEGSFPPVAAPLDVVQMDHTPVDVIVVDDVSRQPIGRPYLTVGIDVYSRCITGFCLTLEAPSAVSVGLCLAHSVVDKDAYLARLGIEGDWPIWGTPRLIHVDNGPEFHSEALRRGCAQHHIAIDYRPMGEPQYGGVIERVIGTLMQHVHTLPGTTFSNPAERGDYDADGTAVLTLRELEKWLALVIVGKYHNEIHAALAEPPIARFKAALLGTATQPGTGPKPLVQNTRAFVLDFLPIVRRSIQRQGFVIDHIGYYSTALRPWIAERAQQHTFIIRRDPRDISRIYVLHPDHDAYLEVPYRTLSHPAVTLWEQRASLRSLRAQGRRTVDEAAIFRAIAAMRQVTDEAAAKSRAARRTKARTGMALHQAAALQETPQRPVEGQPAESCTSVPRVRPFTDIEEW